MMQVDNLREYLHNKKCKLLNLQSDFMRFGSIYLGDMPFIINTEKEYIFELHRDYSEYYGDELSNAILVDLQDSLCGDRSSELLKQDIKNVLMEQSDLIISVTWSKIKSIVVNEDSIDINGILRIWDIESNND